MKSPLPSLVLLAALAPLARADVWTDPSLGEALAEAELVVVAQAPAEGSSGAPRVTFQVERALAGSAPAAVDVGGLHDPTRVRGASFGPRERVLLILKRGEDGRLSVPTPTLGRYPVREGVVHYFTLRDTYLRLNLPLSDVARFVRLHAGQVDEPWLMNLRGAVAQTGLDAAGPELAQLYLGLEALALAGQEPDAGVVARCLAPAAPFQLRVSACRALGTTAGKRAAGRLLAVATSDPEPAVRTAAIGVLGRLDPPPAGLVQKLAGLLPEATREPVRFSSPNDPRLNKWPSPKAAALRVIGRHGAGPVKEAVLEVVRTPQPEEVFTAALTALIRLEGDRALPGELARCFRSEAEVSAHVYNAEICAALTLLTKQELGDDPDAWRRWIAAQGGE